VREPVLYIVGSYPSTTETFIEREIRGLRERGLEIEVLALDSLAAGGIAAGAMRPGVVLSAFRDLRRGVDRCGIRRAVGAALRGAAIVRNLRAGHIHAHFLGLPATVAYGIWRMTGIPYSITAHARDIYVEKTPEVVAAGAKFRTTCTRTGLYFLKDRYPECLFELVRHGVEVREVPRRAEGEKRELQLLGVGRLVEKKGFGYLVDACGLLQKRGVPFRCRIVGEGPGEAGLRQKIEALGLGDRVEIQRFCPHQQMAGHYAGSDVLVVPSVVAGDGDRDGVPNVILEAMAGGVPVVATGAGGIGEVVIDGLTGVLVGQRDGAGIAAAVSMLHADVQLRQQLAAAARRFIAREFEPSRWMEKLQQLFTQG